ncbi:MAG: efflux RND transporter periplasmic adaptor subunit [Chitinophagaceae bacterium]|nr:efflux RND transporter periplasmic adaptor subunit [Chitinophagaceae bacterium]
MKKKLIWIITGLLVIVIVLVALSKSGALGKDKGIKVSAEKVTRRTIIETVNASGKVYPEVEVKISPDISGEITELTIQEGDSVQKGQVLARIYADIYATQRDQAAAAVSQQQAMVSNSSAQIEALKSSMQTTKSAYDRQKQLLDEKVISRSEFEVAENNYLTAKANYNAALQSIRANQAGVQSASSNLQKANKDLGRTAVLSPMDGVVSLLNVKKGERVVGASMMAGTEMMRLADLAVMEVRVEVGENDIPKVNLGDSALIEIDAYTNRKFKGIVTKIASSNTTAATTTGTGTGDVINYEVRIRLLPSSYSDLLGGASGKNFPFRPGMSASADIQTKRHIDRIAVPINAVTPREKGSDEPVKGSKDAGKDNDKEEGNAGNDAPATGSAEDLEEVVFVLKTDGTVKKQQVKTDIQDINFIEIVSGLKAGDTVITGSYNTVSKVLKNGMKVQVVAKDKLFEAKNQD